MEKMPLIESIGLLDTNVKEGRETFIKKLREFFHLHPEKRSELMPDDRRQSPRMNISVPVIYQIDQESTSKAITLDISETGVRLAMMEQVKVGTILKLEVKIPNMQEYFKVRGVVVWVKPSLIQAGWECGVAFENLKNVGKKDGFVSFVADQHLKFVLMYTHNYRVAPAINIEQVHGAYRIIYKEYLKRSYCAPNRMRLHYNKYALLPTSKTFILTQKEKMLGTISLIPDSSLGLPMELIFADEIQYLRQQQRLLAEVGFLALDTSRFKKGFFSLTNFKKQASLFRLYKILFDYARLIGSTDLIIGVHPKHETLYKYLNFESFGPVREYPGAEGNLALPMRLNIPEAVRRNRDLKFGPGAYFLKEEGSSIKTLSMKHEWTLEDLADLLVDKKQIWSELSEADKAEFEKFYPGLTSKVKEYQRRFEAIVPEKAILESAHTLRVKLMDQINKYFSK